MSRPLRTATLVKTVLIEAIQPVDDQSPDIRFRVEIFSWSEREYSCQVWRHDTYSVQPSFQYKHLQLADEEWLVLDYGLGWQQLRAPSADQLLILLYEEIERRLLVKVDLPAGSISTTEPDKG